MMTVKQLEERDGFLCGICRIPVDMMLCYPHPASSSIDHIIPSAGGGTDSPLNLQLAHLECNCRKTFLQAPKGTVSLEIKDIVAFEIAAKKHREGSRHGGDVGSRRLKEMHPSIPSTFGERVHKMHPDHGKRMGRLIHTLYPNLAKRAGGRNLELHPDFAVKAAHVRWHENRNVVNKACKFCNAPVEGK